MVSAQRKLAVQEGFLRRPDVGRRDGDIIDVFPDYSNDAVMPMAQRLCSRARRCWCSMTALDRRTASEFAPQPRHQQHSAHKMARIRREHRYTPRKHYWQLIRPKRYSDRDLIRVIRMRSGFDGSHLPRDHLCKLFLRVQRGMPIYEKYPDDDLIKFCIARKIPNTSYKREEIISQLGHADESFVFTRFLDLPPEIRVEIFDFYMASLECEEDYAPPPITLVSTLTRRESLPAFASRFINNNRRFECQVSLSAPPTLENPNGTWALDMSRDTQVFWSKAPEAFIQHVQRLHVMGPLVGNWIVYAKWSIDLSAKGHATVQSLSTIKDDPDEVEAGEQASHVTTVFEKLAEVISARQSLVFRREDATHIMAAFETSQAQRE
ncbi:hypothetical protein AC578_1744 [Pseudocercospora eumusae]|uniref:Uncharacterized protein n=1 Tax=Pseudocercospora eumusae TaxID=321146 RepID=A0A139GUR7_9PEZI|nr:hypothetical protein AC578_1744 [Pseudocercospora eumusae]